MRILLVDDDPGIIVILRRWLAPLNCEIFTASNVDDAILEMKRMPPPDFVLLDLILPPNPAEETVKAITELREFNPALKIVVVSGMDQATLLTTLNNARVDAVLFKGDEMTQKKLLLSMKEALTKAPSSGDLLEYVSNYIATMTEVELKRKSGLIA